ncbi:hypothetical protein ACFSUS_17925 [Spirosoma soli]|uniref:TonB-dependent receptor plug domain-containing protein n=1 Tax=Spirosoma soli TaxID=1770529 RepID=A0ABW5M7J1_9BACT
MKSTCLLLFTLSLLSSHLAVSGCAMASDTLPNQPRRSLGSQSRQASTPMIVPGTRLDTNFRTLPAQSPNVRRVAPAWLRAKASNSSSLYVVDGKVATAAQLRKLKQADAASVEVLEGTKAMNLYGKNARNGMVIITTKAALQPKN